MVSIVVRGIFNAVAFTGAGYLFSKLNKSGYEAEMERHNKALEDLASAKEKWYENEVSKKEKIQELQMQVSEANDDIDETNKALGELKRVRSIRYSGRTFNKEPVLADFYNGSDDMNDYKYLVIVAIGIASGFGLKALLSK